MSFRLAAIIYYAEIQVPVIRIFYLETHIHDQDQDRIQEREQSVSDDEFTSDVRKESKELLAGPAEDHQETEDHDVGQWTQPHHPDLLPRGHQGALVVQLHRVGQEVKPVHRKYNDNGWEYMIQL